MPGYYPQYYSNFYQQQQIPQQMPQQPQAQPQIQNGGFVSVSSETEARNYPVAPGNSVTFKDETAPYIYTKTMGFSQLDQPVFDKYKLIKEESKEVQEEVKKENEELKKLREGLKITDEDIEDIRRELETLWGEINVLKLPKKPAKRERDGDD